MRKPRAVRADFDSPWKEALEHFLPSCLALFFPAVHAGIAWSRGYESLDKEFHQIACGAAGGGAEADKLFKVWTLNGDEAWLLVHIEVQGEPNDEFPLRMFRYNVRAFDRYNRTVVSLAVLTDERPDWRPDAFGYGAWGASTGIHFLVAKLLDWRGREAALDTSVNPFAPVVLAHLAALATRHDPEGRREVKIQVVKGLYRRGWSAEDVRQLFRVVDWLLELPATFQGEFQESLYTWEETMRMPYITSVERWGIEKGRREGFLESLAAVLESRFGASGKRLMSKVRDVPDDNKLKALLRTAAAAESLKEIRDLLKSHPA